MALVITVEWGYSEKCGCFEGIIKRTLTVNSEFSDTFRSSPYFKVAPFYCNYYQRISTYYLTQRTYVDSSFSNIVNKYNHFIDNIIPIFEEK